MLTPETFGPLKGARDGVEQILIPKGLGRKSIAPAFIALAQVGMSPCPVIKMIDSSRPAAASAFCNSNPFNPGIRKSRITQDGPGVGGRERKARAEEKHSNE